MNTSEIFDVEGAEPLQAVRLAYIKTLKLDQARALGIIPADLVLPAGTKLYAIHAADGTPIGVMDTWASAYGTALQNDFLPMSVH